MIFILFLDSKTGRTTVWFSLLTNQHAGQVKLIRWCLYKGIRKSCTRNGRAFQEEYLTGIKKSTDKEISWLIFLSDWTIGCYLSVPCIPSSWFFIYIYKPNITRFIITDITLDIRRCWATYACIINSFTLFLGGCPCLLCRILNNS